MYKEKPHLLYFRSRRKYKNFTKAFQVKKKALEIRKLGLTEKSQYY